MRYATLSIEKYEKWAVEGFVSGKGKNIRQEAFGWFYGPLHAF